MSEVVAGAEMGREAGTAGAAAAGALGGADEEVAAAAAAPTLASADSPFCCRASEVPSDAAGVAF